MTTITIATSWFPTIYHALRFYDNKGLKPEQVEEKLVSKKIFLGTPPRRKKEKKRFVKNDRWVILVQA